VILPTEPELEADDPTGWKAIGLARRFRDAQFFWWKGRLVRSYSSKELARYVYVALRGPEPRT
jgi:hypothetical protein